MQRIKAFVVTGYGINCEKEMARAFELAEAEVSFVHAKEMFSREFPWSDAQLILFPGGFSFGDELGAAKAFANKLSYNATNLRDRLQDFVNRGNCLLGICNGFQLLVKLGLLPGDEGSKFNQTVSLTNNDSSRFECRWTHHKVCPSPCIFTRGLDLLYLPVRHGEGKFVGSPECIARLFHQRQVVLQYCDEKGNVSDDFPANPNGSAKAIGGLCDPTGRIFGMMAHPEAAVSFTNDPQWTRIKDRLLREHYPLPKYGPSLQLFTNAIQYLKESK